MARIVGGLATSHVPLIGVAMAERRQDDPDWKPFFDAYRPARAWLEAARPDTAIVVYNDHGLNFFLDKLPTFAVGAAPLYGNADEGWGIPVLPPYRGDPAFSWHLIESLIDDEFDLTTCQEMLVDHGFTVPMRLFWGDRAQTAVTTVPLSINTVQHPLPSPRRCYRLGQALGRAVASCAEDRRVVVIGAGGLSHQLDGRRAGFINRAFDRMCLERLADDPEWFLSMTPRDLIRRAGTQGVELLCWLAMRGALGDRVRRVHAHYQAPVSNTGAGLLVLDPVAGRAAG